MYRLPGHVIALSRELLLKLNKDFTRSAEVQHACFILFPLRLVFLYQLFVEVQQLGQSKYQQSHIHLGVLTGPYGPYQLNFVRFLSLAGSGRDENSEPWHLTCSTFKLSHFPCKSETRLKYHLRKSNLIIDLKMSFSIVFSKSSA